MKKNSFYGWRLGIFFLVTLLIPLQAQNSLPELLEKLETFLQEEKNSNARKKIIETVGKFGPEAESAASILAEHLKKETSPEVRMATVATLAQILPPVLLVFPFLEFFPNETDPTIRKKMIEALGKAENGIIEGVPLLITRFKEEKNGEVRATILWALSQAQPAPEAAITLFIDALIDPDADVKENAAWSLGKAGGAAEEAIPSLMEVLKGGNKHIRSDAAWALGKIRKKASIAVPALIEALKDESKNVRKEAAWALGEFHEEAEAAFGILIEIANYDADFEVRREARTAQQLIGASQKNVLQPLMESLTHPSEETRYKAVMSLGKLGYKAAAAIPNLVPLLSEKDWKIRMETLITFGKIGEQALNVSDSIIPLCRDPEWKVQVEALNTLNLIRVPAPKRFDIFLRALQSPQLEIQQVAIKNLGGLESAAKNAVPELILLFNHPEERIRFEVRLALQLIGPPPLETLSRLLPLVSSRNEEIRVNAVTAIGSIGPSAKEAAPRLKDALSDVSAMVREQAIWALAQIGISTEKKEVPEKAIPSPSIKPANPSIPVLVRKRNIQLRKNLILLCVGSFLGLVSIFMISAILQHLLLTSNPQTPLSADALEEAFSVTSLIKALEDPDWTIRQSLLPMLEKYLFTAPEVPYTMVRMIKDSQTEVSGSAAVILSQNIEKLPEIVPSLLQALKHEQDHTRRNTVWVLGHLKKFSPEVLSALIQLLYEDRFEVRYLVQHALCEVPIATLFPHLLSMLDSEDAVLRVDALRICSLLREKSPALEACLIETLEDADDEVSHEAVLALSFLDVSPEKTLPTFLKTVSPKEP